MSFPQHNNKRTLGLEHRQPCEDGPLHPQALAGLELFNHGAYFEAHEALETAWKVETGSVRDLYRGILQIAVMYHHIKRNNFAGAIKMYQHSMQWLQPFPAICMGVDIGDLRQNCEAVFTELARLGPSRMSNFNQALLLPIKYSDFDTTD